MSFQNIISDRHNAIIDAAQASRDAEVQRIIDQENATISARKTEIKYLVEKVYFSYTLSIPTATQAQTWAKAIFDGVDPMSILQGYILPESIYNNASHSAIVHRAFNTILGRSPSHSELNHYSEFDNNLIPAMISLEANGADAQALTWRMQLFPNLQSIMNSASVPSAIAHQLIEQTFATLPSFGSSDIALSTLNTYLTAWKNQQTSDNNSMTDKTPPTGVSASIIGKLLVMQFSETIDWAKLDADNNGRISLDSELLVSVSDVTKTITSSTPSLNPTQQPGTPVTTSITVPGTLGYGAAVLVADSNRLVLQLGQSPEIGNSVVLVGICDLYGNSSDVIYNL